MKLLKNILNAGNAILERTGSETPNQACPDRWKCLGCGLVWYYPKTVDTRGRSLSAERAGKPCRYSDGGHILMKDS